MASARRALACAAVAALALALGASSAQAALSIESFQTTASTSLAGAHPDLHTEFRLSGVGPEVAKNVTFNAPSGVFGNPSALTTCSTQDFALQQCPPNAQAGLITIHANYEGKPNFLLGTAPIYVVVPGEEDAARFAFYVPVLDIPISIPVTVRSATDYGLRFTVSGITQLTPLTEASLDFWGFPAAASHTPDRFPKGSPGKPAGCPELADASCNPSPTKASVPLVPFTGNPSVCGADLPTELRVETYQQPGASDAAVSSYPAITNCDRQTFQPVAQARLTSAEADSPSGMDFEFEIPQAQSLAASPSQLRAATLYLPDGLTINPGAADGQGACTDADAGIGQEGPGHCPDNAKVGTVTISSDSLPGDLAGSIYLGEPKPGNTYRLLVIADGYGIHAKLVGKLLPDPASGRLTAQFEDLPRLPLERFDLHLFASDRGVFATPTHCAVYGVESRLFPWNETLPDRISQFGVGVGTGPSGSACPPQLRPFQPRLEAGTASSEAGSFSAFTLKLDRDDGDQYLRDLNFTMPPGLSGSLRGISYCPEAAITAAGSRAGRSELAAPSCPATSKIGTTNVAAGPGSHPFHAVGSMYLAGPFNGAPLSLVAVTPALAGPYDYGVVVVRIAVNVNSLDAHVTALSDTVPAIIGGIPLRLRSIQVNLDRPHFILNPTDCSPAAVFSEGVGDQGTAVGFSSFFQVAGCATLGFKPRMTITARGGAARSRNPTVEFHLHTRRADANVRTVAVTLSKAFAIDQRHIGQICTEAELRTTRCAGRAAIGRASVKTPLLDRPLAGPVYAVSGGGGLPRLAFVLDGQVPVVPRARSFSTKGALKTVVPTIPDVPIGDFRLTVFGGKRGYLINTRSLCRAPAISKIDFVGQNGRERTQRVRAKVRCGGS